VSGATGSAGFAARRDALAGRIRTLGRYGFARASEEPYRRRPVDGLWLVASAVLVVLMAQHHDDPTGFETKVFETVNALPDQLQGLAEFLYQIGTLWALGLVLVAALLARRWRLARDLLLAGVVAWVLGRILAVLIGGDSISDAVDIVVRADATPSYPLVRIGVIAAVMGFPEVGARAGVG